MENSSRAKGARRSRNNQASTNSALSSISAHVSKGEPAASAPVAAKTRKKGKASEKASAASVRRQSSSKRDHDQRSVKEERLAKQSDYEHEHEHEREPEIETLHQARRSVASDQGSSSASQRDFSPFSAPATPATAHSVATNVSNVSETRKRDSGRLHAKGGKPSERTEDDGSANTLIDKGKAKAQSASREQTSPPVPSSRRRSKRKEASPSPSAFPSKRVRTNTSGPVARQYSLRSASSASSMTPARKAAGATAPTAPVKSRSHHATKGRTSRGGETGAEASSCSRSDVMDVEGGVDAKKEEILPFESHPAGSADAEEEDEVEQDTFADHHHALDGDDVMQEDSQASMREDDDEEPDIDEDEDYEDEEDEEGEGPYEEDGFEDPYDDEGGAHSSGFGGQFRAMAGYMSGLAGRFRTLLNSLRDRKDPSTQLVALQELSEVLSISNEDTLAGYFPTETFVGELIYLMGGPKPARPVTNSKEKTSAELEREQEEEEALAAAALLGDNGEMMLLACRCLANLIEAMPYAAHSVVSHGAIPVLNAKLVEIEFIDLAEQVLQTMEKISNEYPSAIVREGGLSAMLQYLDFFNIHVQRTAMTAAANCCRRMSTEQFDKAKDVMPIIQNVLSYSDQRLVESACRCIVRLTDSYRHHTELLEQLLTHDVVAAINAILLPGSTSSSNTVVSTAIYTDVLKALGTAARASPTVAVTLLEDNIVETLYVLLTGSSAPKEGTDDAVLVKSIVDDHMHVDGSNSGAALAIVEKNGQNTVGMADVAVLQNLAQRPKEQVQEALSLVAELLPPLPREGVFDPRLYTEKGYNKRKARATRQERQRSTKRDSEKSQSTSSPDASSRANDLSGSSANAKKIEKSKPERVKMERELAKEQAQARRVAALREKHDLVKRFTKLVLPTLVEVYAASVGWSVRSKALYGILKIVSFVEAEPLLEALDAVPLASFVASILSSRDHPMLVQGALQLVELLTIKLPDVYSALLRREGVMWEIDDIASSEPKSLSKEGKENNEANLDAQPESLPSASATTSSGVALPLGEGIPVLSSSTLASSNLSRLLAAASSSGAATGSLSLLQGDGSGRLSRNATSVGTTIGGHAMSASDAEESNIWRARTLCDLLSPEASDASAGGADEAGRALKEIKVLVDALHKQEGVVAEESVQTTLESIAALFSKPDNPISSFELVRSGLVEGLYEFAIGDSDELPQETRRQLLTQSFMRDMVNDQGMRTSAASALVRRLQETLSRLETVEIMTTIYSGDENRRSPTANVARQVRLKLIAENAGENEIPRSCTNIVVSIHAITSFQSLHDYLRPKIAASQTLAGSSTSTSFPGGSSGLSTMLESLASSAGLELSLSLRESLRAAAAAGSSTGENSNEARLRIARKNDGAVENPNKDRDSGKEGDPKKSGRRRSSRLSAKSGQDDQSNTAATKTDASREQDDRETHDDEAALTRRLVEGFLQDGMADVEGDEAFSDEYDEELVDEDALAGLTANGIEGTGGDETIQLEVSQDAEGQKTSKETERSGEKALSQSLPSSSSDPIQTSSSGKASYASALQKRPVDWHLEFEIDGQKIELESTIYSAVHRQEMRNRSSDGHNAATRQAWMNTYTVKYRKVPGAAPATAKREAKATPEPTQMLDEQERLPESIDKDSPYARILLLLRVIYTLNREWRESQGWQRGDATASHALVESAFVNNKLTAKLNRQLEEPMIVASSCMPSWSIDLPRTFPFLFPFEARYAFLQSTSFGYHRLINRWQTLQSRNQEGSTSSSSGARHDDSLALLGRLTRQKVRISRSNILASAFKVFELYGTNSSLLEVEYFDEVGTGLGPTLEFYAMVSKDFARKSTNMWRSDESKDGESEYAYAAHGLFPAPISERDLDSPEGKARLHSFKILGQFVAKALFDSRIIDLNFSSMFMRAVLREAVPSTVGMLRTVDEGLARSLEKMRDMSKADIEGLMLDFTLPGYSSYEMHPGGKDESVSSANVEQYIDEVVAHTLKTGIKPLVRAFREGFDLIFPISAMSTFTPEELVMLFGNQEEDWDEATLLSSIKPDHGYNVDSPTFRDVIAVMAAFSPAERREFLQWLTGSPKLPVGGFMGLHPQLTIVKRPPESNLNADQTLPSVMTCVNFCKMPPFSNRQVMRERLVLAMREGQASFHLS